MDHAKIIQEDRVEDTIIPIDYLLINYRTRFFGAILVLLEKYATDAIDTAGVMVKDGRGSLAFNPDFMAGLSFNDRCFILMHEAAHLLLSSMSRGLNKQKEFWNLATDIIINEMLVRNFGLKEPKDLFNFAAMTKMKLVEKGEMLLQAHAAEDIYAKLVNGVKKITIKRYLVEKDGRKSIIKMAEVETKGGGKFSFRFYGEPFDDENLDPRLKGKIEEIVKQGMDSLYGTETGNMLRQLKTIYGIYFPFEMILRKVFERKEFDFSRGNRRFREAGTFFPRRRNEKFKVYAAVDVSGSCSDLTEKFLSYITALPEFEEVVFFDTGIKKVVKKGDPIPGSMTGYGGTDMNVVFDRWNSIEKKNRNTKLNFVALTDGEIPEVIKLTKTQPLIFTTHLEIPGCKNIKIKG